jgi:magnesium transporter
MMQRLIKKRSPKVGLPPGTLVHIGEKKVEKARITIMDYDETNLEEKEAKTIEESYPFKDKPTVTWINIDGLHEVEIIEKLGSHFGLHPLLLEDILNTDQRPKMEDYGDYIFIVLKMLYHGENKDEIETEQVSLILGSNFVISLQESEGDVFDSLRDRIRKNKGRIRTAGADYLAYALLDAIVDNYFLILENVGEKIEDTEQQLATNPSLKLCSISEN